MRKKIDDPSTSGLRHYVLDRSPHYRDAEKLFEALADIEFVGYVSAVSPLNVHYFAEKEVDPSFAKDEVVKLLSLLAVCPIDGSCFETALSLGFDDYEDAVQCAAAVAEGVDAIVTRNTKDFRASPVMVYSPAEFLGALGAEMKGTENT